MPGEGREAPLAVMVKPVGSRCNMRCAYCYYLEKGKFSGSRKQTCMSYSLLEKLREDDGREHECAACNLVERQDVAKEKNAKQRGEHRFLRQYDRRHGRRHQPLSGILQGAGEPGGEKPAKGDRPHGGADVGAGQQRPFRRQRQKRHAQRRPHDERHARETQGVRVGFRHETLHHANLRAKHEGARDGKDLPERHARG